MANIYDMNAALQQPNAVGNFNQGVQQGQQNQVYGEKQQAYQTALANQQNIAALAPKIIAGDPQAADQAAAIDPAQAATYQDAAQQHVKRLQGAIAYIDQQKTPQAKDAAYQQVKPYLAQFSPAGSQPPATFAEAEPKMEAARAQIAALSGGQKQGYINVAAGGALVDPTTGQPVFQNQGVQKAPGVVSVNLPDGSSQQYTQNPDGSLSPLRLSGAPAGAGAAAPAGAATTGLPAAVQSVESGNNPNAVSPKGAQGLMQLMPATAANPGFGITPAQDSSPQENQRVGQQYLQKLTEKYGGNTQLALAAYNAGPSAVDAAMATANGNPQQAIAMLPAETQQYIPKVMAALGGSGSGGSGPTMGDPQQLGRSAPKVQDVQTLSAADVAALGLPPGTVAQRAPNGKIDVINKPGLDSSAVTAPGDPTKSGDAYLQTLPPAMQGVVKAIAAGDQAPPSSSSRSPAAQALLQAVYTYDPTASASNLPSRTATRKSFTSGKDAQNMTALSQLALHLDHLNSQIGTVSGLPLPDFVNGTINAVNDKLSGNTTAFDSSANAVAHELRAVFANAGGGTEAELDQNLKQLNSSNSLAQKQAAIRNIAQLVHGRFGVLQDKYSQGMGKTEDPFQSSYPGAEDTILRLSGAAPDQASAPGPQQQPSATARAKPQYRAVNSVGHAVVWNGSAWVPE